MRKVSKRKTKKRNPKEDYEDKETIWEDFSLPNSTGMLFSVESIISYVINYINSDLRFHSPYINLSFNDVNKHILHFTKLKDGSFEIKNSFQKLYIALKLVNLGFELDRSLEFNRVIIYSKLPRSKSWSFENGIIAYNLYVNQMLINLLLNYFTLI